MKLPPSPFVPIKYQPLGGLNSDLDPLAPQSSSYQDALNIHHLTQGGQTTVSIENCLGNTFAYTLPTVTTQNKIFRVYVDVDSIVREIRFYDGNNVLLATAAPIQWSSNVNLATSYASVIAAINAAVFTIPQTIVLGALVTTSATTGYFSLEITTVPLWDYSLLVFDPFNSSALATPIITQEAIDASLTGMLLHIGSYDVDGDLMVWSTPQTELPSTIAVTGAVNAGGLVRLTVGDTTGIVANGLIKVSGVLGTTEANGLWIASNVTATTVDLLGSVFASAYVSGGTITINVNGLGEIGVAERNDNSSTWNYTTLLRSREFNFRTKNQVKTVCERNHNQLNCYWCDGNNTYSNPYRRFYYQGAYTSNGAINYINSLGLYNYGTIYNETRLFQGNGLANIEYSDQLQSGGALYAGNYRYIVRFLDEFYNPTLWCDPSGLFVVYQNTNLPTNSASVAERVFGNQSTDITGKINQMVISGIIPNLFKYVELGALFYVDGTTVPNATIVKRELLDQTTTQIIQHTGNETNVQLLDIATLLAVQPDILTGLNIDIIANRLVPSNTTSHSTTDFQSWVDTFQYNLLQDSIGAIVDDSDGKPQNVGEYQLSTNTFNKMAFMINETYRMSCKFELLNGAFVENFHFSDITVNTSATSPDGKRLAGLPNTDLTDINGTVVYVPYLQVVNIDWNHQINGIPMKDIVKKIHWEMVEMTEQFREVWMGLLAMGCAMPQPLGPGGDYYWTKASDKACTNLINHQFYASATYNRQDLTDYILAEGVWIRTGQDQIAYGATPDVNNIATKRRYASFYSMDVIHGLSDIQFVSGNQVIVFGAPSILQEAQTVPSSYISPLISGAFKEFSGYTNAATTSYVVDELIVINQDGDAAFTAGDIYSKHVEFTSNNGPGQALSIFNYPTSPVIHTDNASGDIVYQGSGTDYGIYLAQYYLPKTNKFGNTSQSKYVPTGWKTEYLDTTTNVYGDTFTQKTWWKHRVPISLLNPQTGVALTTTCGGATFDKSGFGGGIAFYSQNRVNTQMVNRANGQSPNSWQYPYPDSLEQWLVNFENNLTPTYNSGYTSQQGISSDVAFDPDLPRSDRTPARFWWSLNKPQNSIADLYTIILPLNFRDLDLTHSEIFHHANINGNLMTWQNRHYEMQYFDNTGLISSSTTDVVFGSSGVATQRGSTLSQFGTKHGFSVIKGKSPGGKETAYWINSENGKVMRFASSDGTVCLSDLQDMRWFFNNKLRFADFAFTPADGEGIHGVWDEQNSEAIWTVRAHKQLSDYSALTTYSLGDEVYYRPSVFSTFEQTGEIYVSLVNNNAALPTDTSSWELISHDNINYYNEFTISYSEPLKKFSTRYSHLPKIYLKRGKHFLSPRPVENQSFAYEHYSGELCVWYRDTTATTSDIEQAPGWFIDGMIINDDVNIDKHFLALEMMTEIVPERIDVENKKYATFMAAADFEARGDYFVGAIKNDTLTANTLLSTPTNEQDTSTIFGSYAAFKLRGSSRIYQKLYNFICKVKVNSRTYKT